MYDLETTNNLKDNISRVIDKKLILIDSKPNINTFVGIKNSLFNSSSSSISQRKAIEDILIKHSSLPLKISESDRLRLKHLVLPRVDKSSLGWDSASREVPFWSAVELYEADLQYLLSKDLSEHLPVTYARDALVAEIGRSRLHPRFGRGSKVSKQQYQRLICATKPGWRRHLAELGIRIDPAPDCQLVAGSCVCPKKKNTRRSETCSGRAVNRTSIFQRPDPSSPTRGTGKFAIFGPP
jgi:hypothetical protein